MYDFWFTLGSAIIDPGFLTTITNALDKPFFQLLTLRLILETDPITGKIQTISQNTRTAGLLDLDKTPKFRLAVRAALPASAPPVSIYAAGRLSQLLVVPGIKFADVMSKASTAYANAKATVNPGNLPASFPAVIGLCLLDSTLASLIAKPGDFTPDGTDLKEFMMEFGISATPNTPERQMISNYVHDTKFGEAASSLLAGDSTPWQDVCGDQFFFWSPQNVRAVI